MNENGKSIIGSTMSLRELQTYQDIFCNAQKIFLKCYDETGIAVTKLSGNPDDIKQLNERFGKFRIKQMLQEVAELASSSATLLWKDTEYRNIKLVGIPNIVHGKTHGVWTGIVVYRADEYPVGTQDLADTTTLEGVMTKDEVGNVLLMIQKIAHLVVSKAEDNNKALDQIKAYKEYEQRIQEELRRTEVTNKIYQLMQKEEPLSEVMQEVLQEVVEYLHINSAVVLVVEQQTPVVYAKFGDTESIDEDTIPQGFIEALLQYHKNDSFLEGNKERTIGPVKDLMVQYQIQSFLLVPIVSEGEHKRFALFVENRYCRELDRETERFLNDVNKMAQNLYVRQTANESLQNSHRALEEILNNLGSGVFVVDKETKEILFSNDIVDRMCGRDMVGKHCYDVHFGDLHEKCQFCLPLKNRKHFMEMYDDKMERWYEIKYSDITWVDGRIVSLCHLTDVTDKKKYQQRIEFQANNDFLTGLFNRMRCEDDINICIRKAITERSSGAVLFIDLDDFKHINDGLGHQYGDSLLKMISVELQQIEGIEGHCYRMGGDEFVILIDPEVYDQLDEIVEELKNLFAKPWNLGGTEYYCTMSMGVVQFPGNGSTVHELIKKADIAMYEAKHQGKNRVVIYDKGHDQTSYVQLDLEKNMRSAVASRCNEFEVYIQPIVDVETEQCIGGEALLRWNSRKMGFLPPGEFIPLAEHLGLITPIGEFVLEEACKLNKKWSDQGIDLHINVNLSIVQLLANNVIDVIRGIVERTGVKTDNLVLEVTESLAINDMERMKKIIREIKKMGIHIALDDFGTGYSSLNYIKEMDLDIIKVDRTFIKDIADDDYAKAFVKLIADLSDQLHVDVCVEGVEDKRQLEILRTMNIEMIQGYYYGKPMRIQEYEEEYLKPLLTSFCNK